MKTQPTMKLIGQLETIQEVMDDVRLVLEQYETVRKELSEEEFDKIDGTPVGYLLDTLEDLSYSIEKA